VNSSPPPCGTIVITHKALSTSNQRANEFFDCPDGYFLADGTLIAASLSDLFDGSILNSINRIETGNVNNNSGPELKQCI
jgi:hypothetical protein